jgi:hypothetical protein
MQLSANAGKPQLDAKLQGVTQAREQIRTNMFNGIKMPPFKEMLLVERLQDCAKAALKDPGAKDEPRKVEEICSIANDGLKLMKKEPVVGPEEVGRLMFISASELEMQKIELQKSAAALYREAIERYFQSGPWRSISDEEGFNKIWGMFHTMYETEYGHLLKAGNSEGTAAALLRESKPIQETVEYMRKMISFNDNLAPFAELLDSRIRAPWVGYGR